MNLKYAALWMITLSCSAQACAQDLHCDASNGKPVTSLHQLPAQILDLLGSDKTGTEGIADIGGKFNPSDAIVDQSVPTRRLVDGVAGPDCICLSVEYGSVGHYQKKLEYRLVGHDWKQLTANAAMAPRVR